MDAEQAVARCPVCRAELVPDVARQHRPFCSERCRLVDLSKWLRGEYTIAGAAADDAIEDDNSEE